MNVPNLDLSLVNNTRSACLMLLLQFKSSLTFKKHFQHKTLYLFQLHIYKKKISFLSVTIKFKLWTFLV